MRLVFLFLSEQLLAIGQDEGATKSFKNDLMRHFNLIPAFVNAWNVTDSKLRSHAVNISRTKNSGKVVRESQGFSSIRPSVNTGNSGRTSIRKTRLNRLTQYYGKNFDFHFSKTHWYEILTDPLTFAE